MGSPKRVLHLWQAGYPWEVRVGKINRALQAMGAEVSVLCRLQSGQALSVVQDGVLIQRVGPSGPASLPFPGSPLWKLRLRKAIARFKPDLILVRDIPLAGIAASEAQRAGVPIILDMAEHYPEAMRSWKKYSSHWLLKKMVHDWRLPDRLEAKVVPKMDGIWVVCEEQRERLVRDFGVDPKKVCLVLNTPERPPAELPALTPTKPRRFGYHGILCEDRELEVILKGFDLFVEAQPTAEQAELSLLIAGGGETEAELRALGQSLKHPDKVRFTGRYSPESLPGLYEAVDFGIVSLRANTFTEHTLANKFFDYAALGKPFVFPKIRPLVRVMEDLRCGLGFEPGSPASVAETFAKLIQADYAGLAQAGVRGIQARYHWGVDAKRIQQFLEQIQRSS